MPTMNLTTKASNQVWASPDGQRKIYELTMDYNGQPVKAKTYSDAIATVGWSGEVESYEKAGRNGMETFVKQPPKEGGSNYGGSTGRSSGGKFQADPFTMYLSYAKDLMVAQIAAGNKIAYGVAIETVIGGAYELYNNRPEARAEVNVKEPDVVHEVTDAPIDLTVVDKVFNADPEQEEELPWPKTT